MDRSYRTRGLIVVAMVIAMAVLFTIRLFAIQLTVDRETAYIAANTTTYEQTVASARGDILDRHGTVLVSNRATYSATLETFVMLNLEDTNGALLSLADACTRNGIEYRDTLPITKSEPYAYTVDELSDNQLYYFKNFMMAREWDTDMSVDNFVARMKKAYEISDEYTEEEARIIMGMRYELDLPRYANAENYKVVSDIDADQLAILKELGIPGMEVVTSTVREIKTPYAAQLLGHTGFMTAEEYDEIYQKKGYSLDATVGKDGFEEAFEEYLHGVDGVKVVTVDAAGNIQDEHWEVEPQSGANVITTIDIQLQAIAEKALEKRIKDMSYGKNEKQDGFDASSGSVVVMDVNNFEVLAAGNYPTYDATRYYEDYDKLIKDEDAPLANRALMYAYAPGSTFKMVTALAGLRNGVDPEDIVEATGVYRVYEDDGYTPQCWIWGESRIGHGEVDMRRALAVSCNIYFYTVADNIGDEAIAEVAKSFGVGQNTGIEMIEEKGAMASAELKAETFEGLDAGWYAADVLMCGIGQSLIRLTPLQLCRYAATLANKGTQYNATFFRRAVSSDFQSLVAENTYPVTASGLISDDEYTIIKEGMRMCAEEGTAKKYLTDTDIEMCCKTGTAQHGSGGSDNAAFVCWAPADDPELAIAVYVEHGATGGFYAQVAIDILEYYFSTKDVVQETKREGLFLTDE